MDRMWEKREWWENGTHNTSLCIVRLLGESCNQADTAAATCSSSGRRVHTSFLSPYTLSTRPVPHSNHLTQIRFSKPKKKTEPKNQMCNQSILDGIILVVGQNFEERSHGAGKAAYSREYGFFHVSAISNDGGCGAPWEHKQPPKSAYQLLQTILFK